MPQEEILARVQDRLYAEVAGADRIKEGLAEAMRALDAKRQEGEDAAEAHRSIASMMTVWLLRVWCPAAYWRMRAMQAGSVCSPGGRLRLISPVARDPGPAPAPVEWELKFRTQGLADWN